MKHFIRTLLAIFLAVCFAGRSDAQSSAETAAYNPAYWLEGTTSYQRDMDKQAVAELNEMVGKAAQKGWNGLLYWGASRNGDKMNYYYKSPYLASQPWAVFERDGLTPLVSAAHQKGLKVMVNMEGVNTYHWQQHHWTAASIEAAATDLAKTGVDAVFEECFETDQDVFVSLARTLRKNNVDYISGTDPMLLREPTFTKLWPETGTINIYNYYLKRDKLYGIATLAQHGSLGLGWAKYWNKPTSLISPMNRNWGINNDYTPAVISYLCMIRALQFRMDNFIIFGGWNAFDPKQTDEWIKKYVNKQETRPTMNIVVLLGNGVNKPSSGEESWNRLFNSGDAITSGAFNAGYNIVVSDKVLPADAYWIYTQGGNETELPKEVVDLFSTNKKVFLQASGELPSGANLKAGWKAAYEQCGVNGLKKFRYAAGTDGPSEQSLPEDQEIEIPYTGYYKGKYLRFTGNDVQRGRDLRAGTVIPKDAMSGQELCSPNKTYGRGPYITGKNNKYLVTTTSLNWETAYPISDLLSGGGVTPSSNVWGIAGKNVTALLAIETTELELTIPGLKDGAKIHVEIWDKKKQKKKEENLVYKAPFKQVLSEYDFILIDTIQ